MLTELKAAAGGAKTAIIAAVILVLLVAAGALWWKVRSGARAKADLQVARQVIKAERETLKITSAIDMRVNTESIQTHTKAQEADHEIASIRAATPAPKPAVPGVVADPGAPGDGGLSADDARIVQLAREARAAAIQSAARLQPARTGAR